VRFRTKLVYLDTNAISNLFHACAERPEQLLSSWRSELVFRVRRGVVRVVVSLYAFEELGPLHRSEPARLEALLNFLQFDVAAPLIVPTEELVSRELQLGRPLKTEELGFDQATSDKLWALARSSRALADVAPETKAKKKRYVEVTKDQLAAMKKGLEEGWPTAVRPDGRPATLGYLAHVADREQLVGIIEHHAKRALELVAEARNLGTRGLGLTPDMVPTLKRYTAYNLGRTVMNARGDRLLPSDVHDHDHYVAARYSDMLVTDDVAFRETVELIDPAFKAMSLSEFFTRPCGPVVSIP
jgi:hypothetical protein